MKRVTGVGGVFFKSRDAKALGEWYQRHLGMNVEPWGGVEFSWANDPAGANGTTTWSPFKHDTKYFEPGTASFMINLRVADLHALVAALKDEGCDILDKVEESEFGKFAHLLDPEGNKVELWEPPPGK